MNKKMIKIFGKLITVISFIFIIRLVINFDIDFRHLLRPQIIATSLLLALLLSSSVWINAFAWKKLLEMFTTPKIKLNEIFNIYAKANIGKYLPGNMMHYASRNIIGDRYDIDHLNMIYSTVLKIILKILSAFMLVIIFVYDDLKYILSHFDKILYIDLSTLVMFIALMILIILTLTYYKGQKSVKQKINGISIFYGLALYTFVFLLNVFIFLMISYIMVEGLEITGKILYASGIYIIAWLLGYLTPGSPGGIGVRESIMVFMLDDIYLVENILLVSIMLRIITIFSDAIAYFISLYLDRKVVVKNEINHSNTLL